MSENKSTNLKMNNSVHFYISTDLFTYQTI